MKRNILWIIAVFLFAGSCGASSVDNYQNHTHFYDTLTDAERAWIDIGQPLTYVYDPDWAPFEWKTRNGIHSGIIADLFVLLKKKTGLKLESLNTDTWAESVAFVEEGKADMFSAITVTEERKQYLDFTLKDIYSYPAVLITQFDDKDIYLDLEKDAQLKTIAIVKDSGLGQYIKQNYPSLNFLMVPSTQEGFKAVLYGNADLFAINTITARYFIEKQYQEEIKIATKLDYIYHLKIAVHKDKPKEVISILNKALGTITDSEQSAIFNRWTHIAEQPSKDWENLVKASVIFLIVFVFLAWHNIKLKILVSQKTKELTNLANTDSLTGAYNRRKLDIDFMHEVKRASRNHRKMALLYLDLNNFKTVNDTYGHKFGDLVLKGVASKVIKTLRDAEQLYRVGGDEFCILVPEISDKDQAFQVAERLKELIASISNVNNKAIDIGCSIGVSVYPDDGEKLDALMASADREMYQEKTLKK